MGAELLVNWYEFDNDPHDEFVRLSDLLDRATDEQLWRWMERNLQIDPEELGYTPEDARATFTEAVGLLQCNFRDIQFMKLRNGWLLVAGGTSYGETTESYDLVGLLDYLGNQPE
jgi:hypothetical protein